MPFGGSAEISSSRTFLPGLSKTILSAIPVPHALKAVR
jgi:hypothetical protein